MKKLYICMSIVIPFIVSSTDSRAFDFGFNKCIQIDQSFYHQVIDPDIIEIGNNKQWSMTIVNCDWQERRFAFSNCANGCPLVANNAVKYEKGIKKICQGDPIYINKYKCQIDKMKPEKY